MVIRKSDLYSTLWACRDELRGGMDASQYKDYPLRACFVRYELADGAGWRTDERERAEGMGRTADAL